MKDELALVACMAALVCCLQQIQLLRARFVFVLAAIQLLQADEQKDLHQHVSLPRSPHWWKAIVCNIENFGPDCFRYFFCITRKRAEWLVERLRAQLQRKGCNAKQPLDVKLIVHAALWRLAHGETEARTGERFGICTSSVHEATCCFCIALCDALLQEYIHMQTLQQLPEVHPTDGSDCQL